MKKISKALAIFSIFGLLAAQSAFADTDTKTATTYGSLGSNSVTAKTDTNDWISPLKDDIVSSTSSTEKVECYVKATIYWQGGSSNDSDQKVGTKASVRVNTNSASDAGVSGKGSHTTTSNDWGSWSTSTSVTF